MQLIVETQPSSEDLKIKMSIQTETAVNGNIGETIKEINLASSTHDAAIASVKESLSIEPDLSVSEDSGDIIQDKEKSHDSNKENDYCVPKVTGILKEDSLVIKGNKSIIDKLTNGTTQDFNELKIINKEDITAESANDIEFSQVKVSHENEKSLQNQEIKSKVTSLSESHSQSEKTFPGKINKENILSESEDTKFLDENNIVLSLETSLSKIHDLNNEKINTASEVSNVASIANSVKLNVETKLTDVNNLDNDDVQMKVATLSVEPENLNKIDICDTTNDIEPEENVALCNEPCTLADDTLEVNNVAPVDDSEDVTMTDLNEIDSPDKIEISNVEVEDSKFCKTPEKAISQVEVDDPKLTKKSDKTSVQKSPTHSHNCIENFVLPQIDELPVNMLEKVLEPNNKILNNNANHVKKMCIQEDAQLLKNEENLKPIQETLNNEEANVEKKVKQTDDLPPLIQINEKVSEIAKDILYENRDNSTTLNEGSVEICDITMAEPNNSLDKTTEVAHGINKLDVEKSDTSSFEIIENVTRVEHGKETTEEPEILLETKSSSDSVIFCQGIESKTALDVASNQNITSIDSAENNTKCLIEENQVSVDNLDEDDVKLVESKIDDNESKTQKEDISHDKQTSETLPVVCKLSNTLDILSDDEEDTTNVESKVPNSNSEDKQCINLDDDDDIMLIEEDSNSSTGEENKEKSVSSDKPKMLDKIKEKTPKQKDDKIDLETGESQETDITDLAPKICEKEPSPEHTSSMDIDALQTGVTSEEKVKNEPAKKQLLPQNFLKTAKKNLAGMSRHELEDFCILRIVESVVDRSSLSDIKSKIKTMAQNLEEYRKRTLMMTRQNRDLQVVLKSVQEEQKNRTDTPIQPLKITRSVGVQVLMNDKLDPRRKGPLATPMQAGNTTSRPVRSTANPKLSKPPGTPPNIPVPRKVPVSNSPAKTLPNTSTNGIANKSVSPSPSVMNIRNPSPVQKGPEKRTHSRMQAASSITVDLTDDEPPPKIINKNNTTPPVRVVPSQSLMPQNKQFGAPTLNNPRKVYIPISGPQSQIRPGQSLMMRNVPVTGPRPRGPMTRPQQNAIRPKQVLRHPAPLPEAMKQYMPPTWKTLPPAPDLKLSKVENGIVISWKINDYPEGGYEPIASYQLYAYQETTAPACTALWKKIGDVKALPLPMACTLTQFMAGFRYYFAVRAVDVKSRLGPFSLPGSIVLINKGKD